MRQVSGRVRILRAGQTGAAMILTAAAIFGLLAVASLVIDVGNAFQRSRSAQSVADASALAGSWDLIIDTDAAKSTAGAYAADNLDTTLPLPTTCVGDSDVTVDTTCYTIGTRVVQITSPWDGSDYRVRVDVCDAVETSFAKLVGFDTVTVCRIAVGEVEEPTPGSPGGPAIQSFGPGDKKAFETTGNGTIWTDGDIFIASTAGEAFVADGDGGVTVEGDVWYDSTGGGCAKPPECGDPGFLDSLPTGCNPSLDCPGGSTHFDDVYAGSAVRSIVFADLRVCLNSDFGSSGCSFYDPGSGYPVHGERSGTETAGPLRTGTTAAPSCDNGSATMQPGHYSTSAQYSIKGCIIMSPGIYLFDGGFDMEGEGYVRGNDVLLINGHDKTVSRITKSAACLTGIRDGSFETFLYYQNPDNDNTFDVESDSILILGGIIYNPDGEIRIQGADAGSVGGDGVVECLGVTVTGGGSIVAKMVLVKSDGTLTIHAMSGGSASGGGGWVRLME